MATTKTLGGDRLGSGKKQKVYLHGYERSTHDLGRIFRTTAAAGTLIPFIVEVALPGDTFDIKLDCDVKTHPTIGPLFGSYKVQLDIFECPVRLYQGQLHNNKLYIGNDMSKVKLPLITLEARRQTPTTGDINNCQINPSCLLAYLGIRGVGFNPQVTEQTRQFNGIPLLSYWDIYKNYYSNKQEEIGAVIHTTVSGPRTISGILINGNPIPQSPAIGTFTVTAAHPLSITYGSGTPPNYNDVIFNTSRGDLTINDIAILLTDDGTEIEGTINFTDLGIFEIINWRYRGPNDIGQLKPEVYTFNLDEIDSMREAILAHASSSTPFDINAAGFEPYNALLTKTGDIYNRLMSQEGLGLKTYQSDLFNNWLNTEWIDGTNGISEVTAIDTSGGSFTIDTLNLSKKVYEMLNRIAVSGGSYNDWQEVVYDHQSYGKTEIPIYMGGLIKELGFQEVVSNSASASDETGNQPLGTLAGKGIMLNKHKGGNITIKTNEISYVIGIVSLTPRIDYSQGNQWDCHLLTMDDFHKPALDEIGFQELITEQMAWWSTQYDLPQTKWQQYSAGKQPAWINYMTSHNKTYGNFAIEDNEMFMTLNRRYEFDNTMGNKMGDLTTYIDPVKYNHIFAQTSIDAQNFWVQIGIDMTVRRKMSAKIMPNL